MVAEKLDAASAGYCVGLRESIAVEPGFCVVVWRAPGQECGQVEGECPAAH